MLFNFKKYMWILWWFGKYRTFNIIIILFFGIYLFSGCNRTNWKQSDQLYENQESGISLIKNTIWDVEFYERSGLVLLEAENGFLQKNTTRIEIRGNACISAPWAISLEEVLESMINSIKILYDLPTVDITQKPVKIKIGDNEAIRAIIAVPIVAMQNDPNRIQIKDHGPNTMQIIDIYVISNQGNTISASIYKGDNDTLNEQALRIIKSIQFICTNEP